ncbi:MAG: hypothetical protein U0796_14120 [Gemmatales bacterium]
MSRRRGFERKHQPLLSRQAFAWRLVRFFLASLVLIGVSLFVGMSGYHFIEGLSWIDSFANASMILSGMGPLAEMKSDAGKLFAGCYALYSGLVLILASGLLLAPLMHRLMHSFHLEEDQAPK